MGPLLLVVDLLFGAALAIGLSTQIIVPLWNKTPLFPFFRHRNRAAQKRVKESREGVQNAELDFEADAYERESARMSGVETDFARSQDDLAVARKERDLGRTEREAARERGSRKGVDAAEDDAGVASEEDAALGYKKSAAKTRAGRNVQL